MAHFAFEQQLSEAVGDLCLELPLYKQRVIFSCGLKKLLKLVFFDSFHPFLTIFHLAGAYGFLH